ITFKLEVEKQPCCVKADAVRLQQAFWNVLSNAVKFTPPDGEVKVEARAVPQSRLFTVTVTDNGLGISREEMDQIFEAFVQGDHAKKFGSFQFGGLGLGLPICRKIIKLHAGDIKVSSDGRGKGSTFVIELPLCETPEPDGTSKPASSLSSVGSAGKGIRILLVEDHEPTRLALAHLLSRRNHRVSPAGSLEEAHSLAKKNRFELVISDIGLPDGSGFELMKELKQRYQLKGIALTGYGMEQDILLSENSGFATHLTKPVRMESLESALARVMQSNDLL
ncbi:MAG: hybrid sensor histidine kinase/response regulator, partial [Verrucomicrobia bacterium]|nr:hybrid sensor histidine kinase/response regulator [Verrucomicrobiota bacterium]